MNVIEHQNEQATSKQREKTRKNERLNAMSDDAKQPQAEQNDNRVSITSPLIVDLGRQRQSDIRALKNSEGVLMKEVLDVVDEVADQLGEESQGRIFMPIVVIYEK